MILQARCNNGRGPCRINFEYPDATEVVPVYYACRVDCTKDHEHTGTAERDSWPVNETIAVYSGPSPIKEAAPYMVRCLLHKDMMHFRKLRTSRSSDMCSGDCLEAEGDKCKCSCGGLNHGIEAK